MFDSARLARQLFDQRHAAVRLARVRVPDRDLWRPRSRQRDEYVAAWLQAHPACRAVGGWSVADYGASVWFYARQAVQWADGSFADVTPIPLSFELPYPFLRHPGGQDEFNQLLEDYGVTIVRFVK